MMNRSLRLSREYDGNRYHLVRDCVQQQKPFAIYNFTSSNQYNEFLNDLDAFGKLNYVVQTITSLSQVEKRIRLVYPSIFLTNEGTKISLDEFKQIVQGSLSHYKLDSVVCLYDGKVSVFYKNGNHHSIGNTIYGSSQINEFNSDFYQIESTYYTFIA
jgi:hypothetical protein